MRQQAVYDYVKKKRGLYAADGGEVPDDGYYDSDSKTWVPHQPDGENLASAEPAAPKGNPVDDIENGAADDETDGDSDSPEPVEAEPAPAAAPPPDRNQQMKDYLAEKYGEASGDGALKSAIEGANKTTKVANVLQGLAGMGGAAGVASGYQSDTSGFDNVRKGAKDKVAQAAGEREAKIQDYLQQERGNRQIDQDSERKAGAAAKLGLQDAAYKAKLSQGQSQFEAKQKSAKEMADAALADKKRHDDQHERELETGRADSATKRAGLLLDKQKYADERADKKTVEKQRTSFLEMENKGMGGRGAPQYISQNMRTQQSIKNAQKMLDEAPKDPVTGKPDYNHLNDKQIHLFNTELERIASNGAPTESGRQAMEADTLASHWAAFKQKVGGHPTPADVGEFVQQNADYLHGLKESVDSTVNSFRRENFDNYDNAGLLAEEHRAKYKAKHPELFPEDQEAAPAPQAAPASPQGGPGLAIGGPALPPVDAIEAEMARRKLKPKTKGASGGF